MPGRYEGSVHTLAGRQLSAPSVEVRTAGTANKAAVFADGDGEFPLLNPLPVVTPNHAGLALDGTVIFYGDPALTYDLSITDGSSRVFGPYNVAPAADVDAVPSGTYVESVATAGGKTVTLSTPDVVTSTSGLLGLHISRNDAVANVVGISFDTATVPQWEMGLDSDTTDMVLLYDKDTPGDQIRVRKGMHVEIGLSVAQPALDKRVRISSTSADPVALTQLLTLDVLSGSPVTTPLNIVNAGVSKFSVGSDGAVSAQGAVSVNAGLTATKIQVGAGAATAGLTLFGTTVSTGSTSVELRNAASGGRTYRVASGIAGFAEGGFCVYDVTGSLHRVTITTGGSIILATATALPLAAAAGHITVPECAGTPTGIPEGDAWGTSLVVDTTGSKLWAYIGGVWKSVTFA